MATDQEPDRDPFYVKFRDEDVAVVVRPDGTGGSFVYVTKYGHAKSDLRDRAFLHIAHRSPATEPGKPDTITHFCEQIRKGS